MRNWTYLPTLMAVTSGCTVPGFGESPSHECTLILAIPITGSVTDKNGHSIIPDRVVVSVDGGRDGDCMTPFVQKSYGCAEQGAGTYTVTVTVRDQSKSKSAVIHADDCHTTDSAELDFAFDIVIDDDASADSTVPTNDGSPETDALQDAVTDEESVPVTCDGKTCGENQYCVHSCRCGIQVLPSDSGVDPCAPPAPYCADALPLRPGQNVFSTECSKMCGGPSVCQVLTPGNLGCTCG